MDVFSHIKEEHIGFKDRMAEIELSIGEGKKAKFDSFYAALHGHHTAEERVIFPLVNDKEAEASQEIVLEMIEEHRLVSYQFSVLAKTTIENETWDAKFGVLKEILEHHMEEEEKEFIPLAREATSKEALVGIMEEFESTHEEAMAEMKKKLE